MQKKISVILPVYNGEKYLRRCINSILQQSDFNINDLDIVAVDDGSQDSSLAILEEYQAQYPSIIRVISQENMGVAKTRNKGIHLARAEYLMFIDQDDFIDPDYCETFYRVAKEGDYDVVLSGFRRPGTGARIINKNIKLKDSAYARYVCTALYSKIHKTSFIRNSGIAVFDTKYGEDIVFTLHEYAKTDSIKVIEGYIGYNWFYNRASVSNTSQKKILDMLPPLLMLLDQEKKYDHKNSQEHMYFVLQTVVFYFLWTGRSAKGSDFAYAYNRVYEWLNANYPGFERNGYLLFGPKGAPLLNRFSVSIFIGLGRLRLMPFFVKLYCRGR